MFAVLLSTLLLAGADPTPAAAAADASAAVAPPPKKSKGSEMACWDERPTGSHVTKHICATKEELEKAQRDAKSALDSRNLGPKNPFGPQ